MSIKCDFHSKKLEFQKIVKLLDTTSDDKDLSRFFTEKCIEVYDQSGGEKYNVNKEIRIKTPILRSDLFNLAIRILLQKELLLLLIEMMQKETKVLHLKTKHHLSTTFQRQML